MPSAKQINVAITTGRPWVLHRSIIQPPITRIDLSAAGVRLFADLPRQMISSHDNHFTIFLSHLLLLFFAGASRGYAVVQKYQDICRSLWYRDDNRSRWRKKGSEVYDFTLVQDNDRKYRKVQDESSQKLRARAAQLTITHSPLQSRQIFKQNWNRWEGKFREESNSWNDL